MEVKNIYDNILQNKYFVNAKNTEFSVRRKIWCHFQTGAVSIVIACRYDCEGAAPNVTIYIFDRLMRCETENWINIHFLPLVPIERKQTRFWFWPLGDSLNK